MKKLFLILCLYLPFAQFLRAQDSLTVYVFLLHDCVISKNYMPQLNDLHTEYASESMNFVGLFPNFSSKKELIQAFSEKHQTAFPLKTDYYKTMVKKFEVSVCPEVVVYNHTKDQVLYQGRVDNGFYDIGKRRRVTTQYDLKNALESIKFNKEIKVKKTTAIGCFINFNDGLK